MAPPLNLDDPEAVNSFLNIIRASATAATQSSSQDLSPTGSPPTSPSTSPPTNEVLNQGEFHNTSNPSTASSGFSTPQIDSGIRAPPSTPAFQATITHNGDHLEAIPEVLDFGTDVSSGSENSIPPHATRAVPDLDDHTVEPETEGNTGEVSKAPPIDHLAALIALANKSTENLSHSKHAPKKGIPAISRTAPSDRAIGVNPARSALTELSDRLKEMSATCAYQDSVISKFRKEHSTKKVDDEMIKIEGGGGSDAEEVGESRKTVTSRVFEESAATSAGVDGAENRENMTYFSSWGTGAPRDAPTARVRTVIITNLPVNTDATLVTLLIHGGSIETLKIAKRADAATATAQVTFTTGDAADAYYAKYPNGIDFRYQGKKYTAFVDKEKTVDLMNGLMRGYLESGASRVVRATGADDDWGMRALKKLAEAKGRTVEAIVDTSRGETRTVVFRFTNISDGVRFKSELVRDDDWETCDIQFVEDPCEKATGVRIEGH